MITIDDCLEAEAIVKEDATIKSILKERYGLTNMDLVAADPWYYGDRFGELLCFCFQEGWIAFAHCIFLHQVCMHPCVNQLLPKYIDLHAAWQLGTVLSEVKS